MIWRSSFKNGTDNIYFFSVPATKKLKEYRNMLDYEQVKERVNRESEILPSLVLWTGIGMVAAILVAVFLSH